MSDREYTEMFTLFQTHGSVMGDNTLFNRCELRGEKEGRNREKREQKRWDNGKRGERKQMRGKIK